MKKISEKYLHESGITAKIWFEENIKGEKIKKVRLQNNGGDTDFIFNKSKSETIKKVGIAFQEIAEFIEKL